MARGVPALFASFRSNQPLTSTPADRCERLGIDSPATHAQKDILQFPIQRRVEIDCLSSSQNARHFYSLSPDGEIEARALLRGVREMGTGLSCLVVSPPEYVPGGAALLPSGGPDYDPPLRFTYEASATTQAVLGGSFTLESFGLFTLISRDSPELPSRRPAATRYSTMLPIRQFQSGFGLDLQPETFLLLLTKPHE